eukprot:gnl/MRDRNA2_/MRDRNA2_81029_c0_seq1.p1 gnl/MRDRNA2_/MRDRNA2_81029_c0~~gnl/MRDRNA2_/MRDRNA2_81029_c0_seq1.p1  ORF type:complete len:1108 (+),score=227.48 gnl/MRDRNA2_/MRDRNA2_81029_c0_seq1:107-3430(+)
MAASKSHGPLVLRDLPADARLDLVGPLCHHALKGNIAGIDECIRNGANVNRDRTPYDLRTALHFAAAGGSLIAVKYLVEKCGAEMQPDSFGRLPIHDAMMAKNFEIRAFLQDVHLSALKMPGQNADDEMHSLMNTVFSLIVREGIYSPNMVFEEVSYFFQQLGLHPMYFKHFTASQIGRHILLLMAAKCSAEASNSKNVQFHIEQERQGVYLSSTGNKNQSRATTEMVSKYMMEIKAAGDAFSLVHMVSDKPVFQDDTGDEPLSLFIVDRDPFENFNSDKVRGEWDLQRVATRAFLQKKAPESTEFYQRCVEEVLVQRSAVISVLAGEAFGKGGSVIQFGFRDEAQNYLVEMEQVFWYTGMYPKRAYGECFANGVTAYHLYFPNTSTEDVGQLVDALQFVCHFKASPGRSQLVWDLVRETLISPPASVYFIAVVKFTFYFFPRESSIDKYEGLPPGERAQLDELFSFERIYETASRHHKFLAKLFEDFVEIAHPDKEKRKKPFSNDELVKQITQEVVVETERALLKTMALFNQALRMTNFFKTKGTPGAMSFRFDPAIIFGPRSRKIYPEIPYGLYMVMGRGFFGFHVRFRDIARGGIRLIKSSTKGVYDRNASTLLDENYNLAFTQQMKNKDIAEGGSKGTILLDSEWSVKGAQNDENGVDCFYKYIDSILDCILEEPGCVSHLPSQEILFFGPDENTAGVMDAGALRARDRGYKYWKALTTGKSALLGGVPHDVYGITTNSVHQYVLEMLEKLGISEQSITKVQTGGPDGDLGSNEILISKDKTIAIIDGSGVVYDPDGLDRQELTRLAKARITVSNFSRSSLSANGLLVKVSDHGPIEFKGVTWRNATDCRDNFIFSDFLHADLFVPCGGRPATVNVANVPSLFALDKSGDASTTCRFKYIVEGANLFFTDDARKYLEQRGVHHFKDASTNKGGVTSSSLEVFVALCMDPDDHEANMTVKGMEEPPQFYQQYVENILEVVRVNARNEFLRMWEESLQYGTSKLECTKMVSQKINSIGDFVRDNLDVHGKDKVLARHILSIAVPPLLLSHVGLEKIMTNTPPNYLAALCASWVASRFVYQYGLRSNEYSFYQFMDGIAHGGKPKL